MSESNTITDLLDAKIQQATTEMSRHLESELWGATFPPKRLTGIEAMLSSYSKNISENIFSPSPLITTLRERQTTMNDDTTIAREAVHKRKVARAEAAADTLFEYLDSLDIEDGNIISWTVVFNDTPSTTYHYVAVRGGTNWFVTGDSSRYTTDALIEKIIGLALRGTVVVDTDINL